MEIWVAEWRDGLLYGEMGGSIESWWLNEIEEWLDREMGG